MNDLPFDWNVFVFLDLSFLGNILDLSFGNVLRNILTKIFDGIVIGDGDFSGDFLNSDLLSVLGDSSSLWNSLDSGFVLVLDNLLLEWNVFNSAFTFNDLLASVDHCIHDLGLLLLGKCGGTLGVPSGIGGGSYGLLIAGGVGRSNWLLIG